MKGKRIVLSVAVMAMTLASGAMANEIYKWTDEDGNVHYEDRPNGAQTQEIIDMTYRSTDNDAVAQRVNQRAEKQTAKREAQSTAAAEQQETADNAAASQARQEKCTRSKARLSAYDNSRRMYRTDENGERVYLDDAQRQEARQKTQEQISEFCS